MDVLLAALKLLADPYVIFLIIASSLFGLFVGAIPGLTAAMAIALLVSPGIAQIGRAHV